MTLAVACAPPEREPVEVRAFASETEKFVVVSRRPASNVMVVADTSNAMLDPINGGSVTPLEQMKSTMGELLSAWSTAGRYGLSVFPDSADGTTACRSGKVVHDIPLTLDVTSDLQAAAARVSGTLHQLGAPGGLPVAGGAPTAATLRALASHHALADPGRDDLVILLTAGLPDCNAALDGASCTCTTGEASCEATSCLDSSAAVEAIGALKARFIGTVVVGFGAPAGPARDALNAMALAGGFARTCARGCGSGACDSSSGYCDSKFYGPEDANVVGLLLAHSSMVLLSADPCWHSLEIRPSEPEFVVVFVNGEKVAPGAETWGYLESEGTPTVTFVGPLCERLENATPLAPVEVEIRVLEAL